MKSILLFIQNDDGLEARFQCALDLARASNGHITCIQPRPIGAYAALEMYGTAMVMAELASEMEQSAGDLQARIEADLAKEGVSWDFITSASPVAKALIDASCLSDILVMSRPSLDKKNPAEIGIISDVVLHSQTPVLIVSETQKSIDLGGVAMIAWNGSFEAAHALRSALPILAQAKETIIVTIDRPKDMNKEDYFPSTAASAYLSRHGISSELTAEAASSRNVGEALAVIASVRKADYLVMGAYGHSRAREYIFGGVTRAMLNTMQVPLLLSH